MLNGNELLGKHLSEGPSTAQYTSRFSARVLIEVIDTWIERKLMCSLQESLLFHPSRHVPGHKNSGRAIQLW